MKRVERLETWEDIKTNDWRKKIPKSGARRGLGWVCCIGLSFQGDPTGRVTGYRSLIIFVLFYFVFEAGGPSS